MDGSGDFHATRVYLDFLFDLLPVGVFRTNASGECVFVSRRWSEISGLGMDKALGKGWISAVHPGDRERVSAEWYASAKEGRDFLLEYRFQRPDGHVTWVLGQSRAEKGAGPGGGGFTGTVTDIGSQKEYQTELDKYRDRLEGLVEQRTADLERSERHARMVVEGSGAGYFRIGRDGCFQTVNAAWLRIHGYSAPDEVIGRHFSLTQTGTELGEAEVIVGRILKGEAIGSGQFSHRKKDGNVGFHSYSAMPVIEGETIVGLEGFLIDDTELVLSRKAAETALELNRRTEAALRESEAKYRLLFESAGVGISIYAPDGLILSFNKKAAATVGGIPEDFVGRNLRDIVPSGQAETYLGRLGQTMEASSPLRFEDWISLPTGLKCFLSVHAAIRTPDGPVLGIQVIAQDITERVEAEKRELEQRRRLVQAEKLASLGTLVAGVAHEINNPNHVIMLNTELLTRVWKSLAPLLDRHFGSDDESLVGGIEYRELRTLMPGILQGTMDSAAAIDDIVRELKDFSSPDMSSRSDEIDLNIAIHGAVALTSSLIKRSTRSFSLGLAEGLPKVKGSFQRLEQVLINLLQNACQAIDDPDQTIRVESSWDPASGEILVVVADGGRGMDGELLSRIKDPFFTTRRSQGGTGLGLSISNSIIEEHGGSLSFTSEPGVGTRACVRISAAGRPGHEEPT